MRNTISQTESGATAGILPASARRQSEPLRVTFGVTGWGWHSSMSHDQLRASCWSTARSRAASTSPRSTTLVARARARRRGARGPLRAARGARHRPDRRLRRPRRRGARGALRERRRRRDDDRLAPAVPQRGRPLPAAHGGGGGRAREAHRARRQGGEGPDDQLEPPPRRVDREALPGARPVAARPDPGGDHRADPRGREVRLAPRLQVLDVRDVVDPAGRAARRREQVAHDPHPRAHRRARAEDRARRARADAAARAAADRRGGREEGGART